MSGFVELDLSYDGCKSKIALCGQAGDMGEPQRRDMNAALMKAGLPWILVRADGERAAYDEQQERIARLEAENARLKGHVERLRDAAQLVYDGEVSCECLWGALRDTAPAKEKPDDEVR